MLREELTSGDANTLELLSNVVRTPKSLPQELLLYAQWWGDHTPYSHGGSTYTRILSRDPQPANLSTASTGVATDDYEESANITSLTKTEVIIDKDFILIDARKADLILNGTVKAVASVACRGDGTYTTYIDSVRFTLLKRTSAGVETQLAQEEYTFATSPSQSAASYASAVSAQMVKDISETIIETTSTIILRIEVFGHVNNVAASNNKIKLNFTRGSADTYLILPVDEVL
jgi:uncharacterized membrane protein